MVGREGGPRPEDMNFKALAADLDLPEPKPKPPENEKIIDLTDEVQGGGVEDVETKDIIPLGPEDEVEVEERTEPNAVLPEGNIPIIKGQRAEQPSVDNQFELEFIEPKTSPNKPKLKTVRGVGLYRGTDLDKSALHQQELNKLRERRRQSRKKL